ncbi:transposase, partial [Streptomyces sp. WAC 01325]|uniref:transposase n=1 Tax=Streptomyces sp. WAC 01325 TaxID=2203202 RepID=UPI0037D9ED45
NTHVSRTMRELIAARLWLTVYQLPPYAPELNPVEGVWSHLKRSLANLTKHNLDQLTALVKTRLKQMQYRPGLIEGLMAKTGLDIQPPQPQPLKISRTAGVQSHSDWTPAVPRHRPLLKRPGDVGVRRPSRSGTDPPWVLQANRRAGRQCVGA